MLRSLYQYASLPLILFTWLMLVSFSQAFTFLLKNPYSCSPPYHTSLSSGIYDDEEGLQKEKEQDQTSALETIKQCMGESSLLEPDGLIIRRAAPGISGFAVDSELGFVGILTNDEKEKPQSTFVVISPGDKSGTLQCPESLLMVQMAGGMDLGTPLLPPDLLARLVAQELDELGSSEEIRSRLELLEVYAVPASTAGKHEQQQKISDEESPIESPPERTEKLKNDVKKFMSSIQNLPGFSTRVEEVEVLDAMNIHADENGNIDRVGFSAILDMLRKRNTQNVPDDKIQFELVVSMDSTKLDARIPVPSPIQALGLALRYGITIKFSEECQMELDSVEVTSRFPAFRPIHELEEDAQIMDGFIPSLFAEATTPPSPDDRVV